MKEIGCFISSHGYGHAMRMTGILEQMIKEIPDLHPHLFTTLPESLFQPPLKNFSLHRVVTDIGLVQNNAFDSDISATVTQLDSLLPYREPLLEELAHKCTDFSLILCDISPLGIAVARRIGIPSVLIENFTWDWIYQPYIHQNQHLQTHTDYLAIQFERADYLIQTEPLCNPKKADLHCGPIFRQVQRSPEEIRRELGGDRRKTVLISMGGIPLDLSFLDKLAALTQYQFICAGQKKSGRVGENVLFFDHNTDLYHPDLINSVDLVVCKSGYSTIAECYQAGVPLACVSRSVFPESRVMEKFIQQHLEGAIISEDEFLSGKWLEKIPPLLLNKKPLTGNENGAVKVAEFLKPLCR